MEITNTEIEKEIKVPTLILTTLDILSKRHSSAQNSPHNLYRYQYLLEKKSSDICNWYTSNNENLFYDGFIHEGCFLLACSNCLQDDILISESNAQEDLQGTDFKLKEGKKPEKPLDVTISIPEYARKLSYKNLIPIILPIYNPEVGKSYPEIFLDNPTKETYQDYIKHIVFHNQRILGNRFPQKLEINVLKKKKEKEEALFYRNNGSTSYFVKIHKTKYNRIMRILNTLDKLTL